MSGLPTAFLFLPGWALPWVAVAAAAAWIIGARRMGFVLAALVGAELVLPPLVEPWLETLPLWILVLGGLTLLLLVAHDLIAFVFNRKVAAHVTAEWLIRLVDFVMLGPLRLLWRLLRRLSGR